MKNHTISESVAISFAICLKFGGKALLGRDGAEIIMHRSIQESIKVIREQFAFKIFDHTKKELNALYEQTLKSRVIPKLKYLDHLKRKDFKFMLGDVTAVDFEIAHLILLLDFVSEKTGLPNPFKYSDNLYQIAENVLNLKGVREYYDQFSGREWAPDYKMKFLEE